MERFKNGLGWVQYAAGLMLFATMPFYFNAWTRWAMIAFFGSWVIECIVEKRWQHLQVERWQWVLFGGFALYYLLTIAYYPIEHDRTYWAELVGRRVPFLVFALIGIVGVNKHYRFREFAWVGLAVSLYAVLSIIFVHIGWEKMVVDPHPLILYHTVFQETYGPHMDWNIFMNMTILMLVMQWRDIQLPRWVRIGNLCFVPLLYIAINLSAGRIGALTSQAILMLCVISLIPHRLQVARWAVLVGCMMVGGLFIVQNPRLNKESLQNENPRQVEWPICVKKIQENPIVGRGASSTVVEVREAFLEEEVCSKIHDEWFKEVMEDPRTAVWAAHPHNQWLQGAMEFGILGIVCTALILLFPFFILRKSAHPILSAGMMLALNMQLFTDCFHILNTSFGLCFYLTIWLLVDIKNEPLRKIV